MVGSLRPSELGAKQSAIDQFAVVKRDTRVRYVTCRGRVLAMRVRDGCQSSVAARVAGLSSVSTMRSER